ncbi:Fe(3+) ABC transporter substrate-binding protein [Sedimenticola selenatireducens]|uniref:Fe(3+) ABC transporter substrate-binding protein n=1 Tax=Sedimenticola selenatireducens TaxID=191960 RepID=A0A557SGV2_9GAMM|nr:Fe(3+) ABC transporter substrate-binding protein [Sedimenticola selenatireducens]TVO76645.1 Fe(3+) ABC transporter substrate-binding protein [Sedimenticola selenatireducens]TVT64088.1 MAG: Fe(3+) ABC transporter substrate-binding protein [Sedimenticola selenatireducens]
MKSSVKLAILTTTLTLSASAMATEVNVYSARKEALIKPLLDQFTSASGIKVNLVTGKADALLKRLKSEGANSPADLFITTDAGRLHRAKEADVLQPISSEKLDAAIPASYRDPEGYWHGLSVRARVITYIKDKVDPKSLSSYEGLADDKWKGRICIRGSGNIYNQSLVASMIEANGEAATQAWAEGFVSNFARPPKGGDRDQVKAAAAGVCDLAIVNTYYLGAMIHSKDENERTAASKVALFWPNQSDRGAHVNISGAGITKSSKNKDAAIKLMEFLASDESQAWYASVNHEYPVKSGVEWSATLKTWDTFKADSLNLSQLGKNNPTAVKLMDKAGWK